MIPLPKISPNALTKYRKLLPSSGCLSETAYFVAPLSKLASITKGISSIHNPGRTLLRVAVTASVLRATCSFNSAPEHCLKLNKTEKHFCYYFYCYYYIQMVYNCLSLLATMDMRFQPPFLCYLSLGLPVNRSLRKPLQRFQYINCIINYEINCIQ